MKKLAILPAVAALALGVSACAKSEDSANSAALNDVTVNEEDALPDANLDAPADVDAASNLDAGAAALNGLDAGNATGNGL